MIGDTTNNTADTIKNTAIDNIAIEHDLARSAWYDDVFGLWFGKHAKSDVLFSGASGARFFQICHDFSKKFRIPPACSGDKPEVIINDDAAMRWFSSVAMPKLPGNAACKPTRWQMEKARRYLSSRHNELLAQALMDAEEVAATGDHTRADRLAYDARQRYTAFKDSTIECHEALHDEDAILALADSVKPFFTLEGELGRQLNSRLKPDNFGVILANQKVGKTTFLVNLAIRASYSVPTLLISTGDETELKLNARIATNLSCSVTQPEYAGRFAVPVPDCQHSAQGTCPLNLAGEPRRGKSWKLLIEDGNTPEDLAEGAVPQARTINDNLYEPCCRCFPNLPHDGSRGAMEAEKQRRRNWKSAVWWQMLDVDLITKRKLKATKVKFRMSCAGGGLRIMSFPTDHLTVEDLDGILEDLDRRDNFVPSVIVIDYADLMKQSDGRSSDKDHDGMRKIFEGLSALRQKYNNLIITATQTNRLGDEVETHTLRTVGRSAKSADNCTWFLTINQVLAEKRAKIMRTSMLYAREGDCDPEQQAMCYRWHEVQDGMAFSAPIFMKIKKGDYKE